MRSNAAAGPDGRLRPCSHSCSVRTETPRSLEKALGNNPFVNRYTDKRYGDVFYVLADANKLPKLVRDELEETLLEILNQDNNPYVRDEILRYMEDDRLQLRPEDIARKLQEGESPISIKM